jgi:hypothetical protein
MKETKTAYARRARISFFGDITEEWQGVEVIGSNNPGIYLVRFSDGLIDEVYEMNIYFT